MSTSKTSFVDYDSIPHNYIKNPDETSKTNTWFELIKMNRVSSTNATENTYDTLTGEKIDVKGGYYG